MPNTYTQLIYHIVFSTKNRETLIRSNLQNNLYSYIGGIIRGHGGTCLEIGGMPDHVHILVRTKPTPAISDFVKTIKAKSTNWVNHETDFQGLFAWQTGYGAFTVSVSQLSAVTHYIQSQKEHHRVTSFKDELLSMLTKHKIEFEEKYLWN